MNTPQLVLRYGMDELRTVNPDSVYAATKATSGLLEDDEAIWSNIATVDLLPLIATCAVTGFAESKPDIEPYVRPSVDIDEYFNFGVLHTCLALKLAAKGSLQGEPFSGNPSRIATGFNLLSLRPEASKITETYCIPSVAAREGVNSISVRDASIIPYKYAGLNQVAINIGELATTKYDGPSQTVAHFVYIGGVTVLAAVDNIYTNLINIVDEQAQENEKLALKKLEW